MGSDEVLEEDLTAVETGRPTSSTGTEDMKSKGYRLVVTYDNLDGCSIYFSSSVKSGR